MSIGLKRGTVLLEPYSDLWHTKAEKVIGLLKSILNGDAVDIQHVGSTSIKGIKSKPIIDIAVGVKSFDDVMKYNEILEQNKIVFRGQDIENQLLYVMGDFDKDTRTHHIHIVIYGGEPWNNYLSFRDYLNTHPQEARKYSNLKEELASRYSQDRMAYTSGKMEMISIILKKAKK